MSYAAIEAKVKSLLETNLTTSATVSQGDFTILDRGISYGIVLEAGTFQTDAISRAVRGQLPDRVRAWDVIIWLFVAYKAERVVSAALSTFRDEVIAILDSYPTLDGTVTRTLGLLAATEPDDVYDKMGSGPFFLSQPLRLSVQAISKATGGEY